MSKRFILNPFATVLDEVYEILVEIDNKHDSSSQKKESSDKLDKFSNISDSSLSLPIYFALLADFEIEDASCWNITKFGIHKSLRGFTVENESNKTNNVQVKDLLKFLDEKNIDVEKTACLIGPSWFKHDLKY